MLDDKSGEDPDLTVSVSLMSEEAKDRYKIESRLEKARSHLVAALTALRGTLSIREAAAVESAIEDELIALRIGLLSGR